MFLDISLIYFRKCKSNYESTDCGNCTRRLGSGARHHKFQKADGGRSTKKVGCKLCARGPREHWITTFHPLNLRNATLIMNRLQEAYNKLDTLFQAFFHWRVVSLLDDITWTGCRKRKQLGCEVVSVVMVLSGNGANRGGRGHNEDYQCFLNSMPDDVTHWHVQSCTWCQAPIIDATTLARAPAFVHSITDPKMCTEVHTVWGHPD